MLTIKEIDFPKVPTELLLTLDQVATQPENPLILSDGTIAEFPNYKTYKINKELKLWLKSVMPFEFFAEYIVAKNWEFKHVDVGRTMGYNYLLDAGGENIATAFYHPNRPEKEINRIVAQTHVWYKLNVSIPHSVIGNVGTRYLLTITPIEHATWLLI